MRPTLSVIIPTHNRYEQLSDLLKSIVSQVLVEPIEVLVVSNLFEENTRSLVLSFGPNFRYFCSGSIGVNKARNVGIENSQAEFLVLLDDDCFLSDNEYLNKVLRFHQEFMDCSALGGVYALGGAANLASAAYHWIADQWLWGSLVQGRITRNLIGGNLSFKKSLLGELRFDETIEFGGAETELLQRMYHSKHQLIFIPELYVEHRLHINNVDFVRKAFLQGLSAARRLDVMYFPLKQQVSGLHFSKYLETQKIRLSRLFRLYYIVYNYSFLLGRTRKKKMNWKVLLVRAWVFSLADFLFAIVRSWYDDIFATMGFSIEDHESIR